MLLSPAYGGRVHPQAITLANTPTANPFRRVLVLQCAGQHHARPAGGTILVVESAGACDLHGTADVAGRWRGTDLLRATRTDGHAPGGNDCVQPIRPSHDGAAAMSTAAPIRMTATWHARMPGRRSVHAASVPANRPFQCSGGSDKRMRGVSKYFGKLPSRPIVLPDEQHSSLQSP
jgi:hypothetical protein